MPLNAARGASRSGRLFWYGALFAIPIAYIWSAAGFVRSSETAILRVVPDDAFYYFQIARQLAAGAGSTADGIAPTNGYHPLWMLLLTALSSVVTDPDMLMRSAIGASLAIQAVACVCMGWGLTPATGWRWAVTGALAWLINPLAFLIAQQAVESSVYAAALMIVFGLYLRIARDEAGLLSPRLAATFGLALGVLCLARTEGTIVCAVAMTWLIVRALRGRTLPAAASGIFIAATVCAVMVAPWLWFSWRQVGTIVQDSAAMKALWHADVQGDFGDRLRNLVYMGEFLSRRAVALMAGRWWLTAALLATFALGSTGLAVLTVIDRHAPLSRAARAALVCFLTIWVVYGLTLTEQQLWWLTLPCLALISILCLSLVGGARRLGLQEQGESWCRFGLLAVSLGAFVSRPAAHGDVYPWQPDVKASQEAIVATVPGTSRIGCFNAGIPMFFRLGHVVALDGLVNHRARVLWAEHRFDEFLREARVEFIADEQRALNRAMRFTQTPPSLDRVASFPLHGWPTGERVLWRVR